MRSSATTAACAIGSTTASRSCSSTKPKSSRARGRAIALPRGPPPSRKAAGLAGQGLTRGSKAAPYNTIFGDGPLDGAGIGRHVHPAGRARAALDVVLDLGVGERVSLVRLAGRSRENDADSVPFQVDQRSARIAGMH